MTTPTNGVATRIAAVILCACFGVQALASDPCEPQWLQPNCVLDFDGDIFHSTVWDDGSGPALFVAGDFRGAGCVPASSVAKWDGVEWSALDEGVSGKINALIAYDDGTGEALYAAGLFSTAGGVSASNIARWDGFQWSALDGGIPSEVTALAVFNDGSGSGNQLYAGAKGSSPHKVLKWDGQSWVGVGDITSFSSWTINAFTVHDDGSGSSLYAGGWFGVDLGQSVSHVVRWNGNEWSVVGGTLGGMVDHLAVYDDGSGAGAMLYAAGSFNVVTGERLKRWNGADWSLVALPSPVSKLSLLKTHTDENQSMLYAVWWNALRRWDGTSWETIATHLNNPAPNANPAHALAFFDDGSGQGEQIYVMGAFTSHSGQDVGRILRQDGNDWRPLQIESASVRRVTGLTSLDDGSGPAMYAYVRFQHADGSTTGDICRWVDDSWQPLGTGLDVGFVPAMAFYQGKLIVSVGSASANGMGFNNIASWDGESWSNLAGGRNAMVRAMAIYDEGSGPMLFVGHGMGSNNHNGVSRWNGTSWSSMGYGVNGPVYALAVHDDGTGPGLYVGGEFNKASGTTVNRIARWDSSGWSILNSHGGRGVSDAASGPDIVRSLVSADLGNGPMLYVSGGFSRAGGSLTANNIAAWNGTSWSALEDTHMNGLPSRAWSMDRLNDGSGEAIYVTGFFSTTLDGVNTQGIAKWNGSAWSAVAGEDGNALLKHKSTGGAYELGSLHSVGDQPSMLFVSQSVYNDGFTWAGIHPASIFTIWRGCLGDLEPPPPCPGDINADGIVNLADFNILAVNFGVGPGATLAQGDLNADGFVNLADFNILAVNFGNDCN